MRLPNGNTIQSAPFIFSGNISTLVKIRRNPFHTKISLKPDLFSSSCFSQWKIRQTNSIKSLTWIFSSQAPVSFSFDSSHHIELKTCPLAELRPLFRLAAIFTIVFLAHILSIIVHPNLKTEKIPQRVTISLSRPLKISPTITQTSRGGSLFRGSPLLSSTQKLLHHWSLRGGKESEKFASAALTRHTAMTASDTPEEGNINSADAHQIDSTLKPTLERCLFEFKNSLGIRSLKTSLIFSERGRLNSVRILNARLPEMEECLSQALQQTSLHISTRRAAAQREVERVFHLY